MQELPAGVIQLGRCSSSSSGWASADAAAAAAGGRRQMQQRRQRVQARQKTLQQQQQCTSRCQADAPDGVSTNQQQKDLAAVAAGLNRAAGAAARVGNQQEGFVAAICDPGRRGCFNQQLRAESCSYGNSLSHAGLA